jgi:hypothetical protein
LDYNCFLPQVTTQKEGVKVQKIHLDVTGVTHIEFDIKSKSKSKGKGGKTKTKTTSEKCKKHQEFFKEVINLMDEERILDKGVTPYKFNFKIPDDARTSFTGDKGHIKYLAKATVDIPWGMDGEGSLEVFVNSLNDLNDEKDTLEKVEAQHEKTFGILCFKSRPVTTNLVINKAGFVCGEVMKINIKVDNSSNKMIKEVQLHLIQVITYHASSEKGREQVHTHKETNMIIDSKDLGEVLPGADETIEHMMEIPEVPPTQEDKESIAIMYKFKVEAVPDVLFSIDSGAEAEITIGNIPHKVAHSTFEPEPEGGFALSAEVKQKYPSLPNYVGSRHLAYRAK